MELYEFSKSFIGPLPNEFSFIYVIFTLVVVILILSFLFYIFKLPFKFFERR